MEEPSRVHLNIIAEGTYIEGILNSESDIRVNGHVEGELNVAGKLVVSENGQITGKLSARAAVIAGKVTGEVQIAQKLLLAETARLEGIVHTGRLVVEEGAIFQGECVMQDAAAEPETAPAPSEAMRRAAA